MANRMSEKLMRMVSSFAAVRVGGVITRVYMCSNGGVGGGDAAEAGGEVYDASVADEGGQGGVLLEDDGPG